ncbi:MAG: NADPH dehydrogenase NamA [Paenibacillaceae bacterium]
MIPLLFTPYKIREIQLSNRIVMSPMCMYSCLAEDGQVTSFHKTHYTSRAAGQVGLIMLEASAVTEQGRITPQDLGIWNDEQITGLQELVGLVHEQGSKIGIQLAHAGRKAMIEGDILAPSAIPFNDQMKIPREMDQNQIKQTIQDFKKAAKRAIEAGFDVLEIHAAHGYLINTFLSPLTNHRQDQFGGDRDNRFIFLEEVIHAIRSFWDGPLFVRISANDYHPDGNHISDYIYYAAKMKQLGVDLIDCSSGAVVPATFNIYPGYQVEYAEQIREHADIATGAVGLITEAAQANQIIVNEQADLVFLGRELLRNPYWASLAAKQLNVTIPSPKQYVRAWL